MTTSILTVNKQPNVNNVDTVEVKVPASMQSSTPLVSTIRSFFNFAGLDHLKRSARSFEREQYSQSFWEFCEASLRIGLTALAAMTIYDLIHQTTLSQKGREFCHNIAADVIYPRSDISDIKTRQSLIDGFVKDDKRCYEPVLGICNNKNETTQKICENLLHTPRSILAKSFNAHCLEASKEVGKDACVEAILNKPDELARFLQKK